ncbi:cAMP-dependent protein kinase regulatory subunit [Choanephora cucurbitarum]|uniref:cAMP-dependent protein kinase regulatory subunit n=1 Tax=Choanephora cucurbitarum TaxID=101091 RepID=A0A1C7NBE6_9FUNG|nr:cAMP-dependent protein kinase regulatory subunit [Choanephora cucurbitarum]
MSHSQEIHPFEQQKPQHYNNEEYTEVLNELNQQVVQHQPEDILQFCATFFLNKLEEERAKARQYDHHPLDPISHASLGPDFHPHGIDEDMHDRQNQDNDDDDEDDEERDTIAGEIPSISGPPPSSRGRRTSVSAESMQPSQHTQEFKKIVIPKSDEQRESIRAAIGNNFLFKNLDEEQYEDVVNAMAEKRISAQTLIIEQGAVGDYFYIVESGELDCFINGNKVTSYGPGGSFGELALMYNAPRAASIQAVTDCVLYALDRVTFRSILMENTARKRRMYERFLEEVPIFKSLEIYERHKIADALESIQYNDQEVVMREGDAGENFYLIESGEAIFYKSLPDGTQKQVMVGKKGDYFGELSLLNDEPRAATVIANGKLRCATLSKKAFIRLLGPVMDILKRNSENYHAVLQKDSQKML